MPEPEENQTTIIPDFFAELISRIAPGFVVIALFLFWSGKDIKGVFSTVGLSVFVLAAAWIIGITLDVGIFCVGKKFHIETLLNKLPSDDKNYHWKYLRTAKAWERGIINKQKALVIFFRNMMSVCGLTTLICIIVEFSSSLESLLPVLYSHCRCYGLLAFVLFFVYWLCWLAQRQCVMIDIEKLIKECPPTDMGLTPNTVLD